MPPHEAGFKIDFIIKLNMYKFVEDSLIPCRHVCMCVFRCVQITLSNSFLISQGHHYVHIYVPDRRNPRVGFQGGASGQNSRVALQDGTPE